jgi:hypothetical protein
MVQQTAIQTYGHCIGGQWVPSEISPAWVRQGAHAQGLAHSQQARDAAQAVVGSRVAGVPTRSTDRVRYSGEMVLEPRPANASRRSLGEAPGAAWGWGARWAYWPPAASP